MNAVLESSNVRLNPTMQRLDPAECSAEDFVDHLNTHALSHRAVVHPIWRDLLDGKFPDPKAAILHLSTQYWGYSSWFQRYLLGAASQSERGVHRRSLLDNLREETGELGDEEINELRELDINPDWVCGIGHPELYARFLAAVGQKDISDLMLDEPVKIWRDLFLQLCSSSGFEVAVGALGIATEGVVRTIYLPWTEAIKKYLEVTPEQRVFFDLHSHVDDEHAEVFNQLAVESAASFQGRAALLAGVNRSLFLRNAFFDALHREMLDMPKGSD